MNDERNDDGAVEHQDAVDAARRANAERGLGFANELVARLTEKIGPLDAATVTITAASSALARSHGSQAAATYLENLAAKLRDAVIVDGDNLH